MLFFFAFLYCLMQWKKDTKLTLHHMGKIFIIKLTGIKFKIRRVTFFKSFFNIKIFGMDFRTHFDDCVKGITITLYFWLVTRKHLWFYFWKKKKKVQGFFWPFWERVPVHTYPFEENIHILLQVWNFHLLVGCLFCSANALITINFY